MGYGSGLGGYDVCHFNGWQSGLCGEVVPVAGHARSGPLLMVWLRHKRDVGRSDAEWYAAAGGCGIPRGSQMDGRRSADNTLRGRFRWHVELHLVQIRRVQCAGAVESKWLRVV